MARTLLSLLIVLSSISSFSEYRVYKLQVSNLNDKPLRIIIGTLDQGQYPEYYPLNKNEKVTYLDSWMCWQRSEGFKDYCKSPEEQLKDKLKKKNSPLTGGFSAN